MLLRFVRSGCQTNPSLVWYLHMCSLFLCAYLFLKKKTKKTRKRRRIPSRHKLCCALQMATFRVKTVQFPSANTDVSTKSWLTAAWELLMLWVKDNSMFRISSYLSNEETPIFILATDFMAIISGDFLPAFPVCLQNTYAKLSLHCIKREIKDIYCEERVSRIHKSIL